MKLRIASFAAVAIGAVLSTTTPAYAFVSEMNSFCKVVRDSANAQGFSAAPGTPFATLVAAKANQTSAKYQQLWTLSKTVGDSNCKRMY